MATPVPHMRRAGARGRYRRSVPSSTKNVQPSIYHWSLVTFHWSFDLFLGHELWRAALGPDTLRWTEGFRERTKAEVAAWEALLPGHAATEARLKLLWERTRAAVASGTAR